MIKNLLIGSPVSLYTGKVRAYLDYKGIPYKEVLATPEVYRDIIIARTGVRFIPVLVTSDDQVIQDSTDIIDHFESLYPDNPIYPDTPCQRFIAFLLEVYGDEWLVNPAMLYRWRYDENKEFAIQEFGKTAAPDASPKQQYEIGLNNSTRFSGALPRLGITDHSQAAVEQSYLALLAELNTHFSHYDYLLGSKPCIGDYGLIGPLYAHLYRDPYSGRLMKDKAPAVAAWVERMIHPVHTTDTTSTTGAYLPQDEIPQTLLPIIKRMFDEQVPVLLETIKQVAQWSKDNSGDSAADGEIPRAIGSLRYTLKNGDETIEEERLVFPYNQWMWQRPYDFYHSLDKQAQAAINSLLTATQQQAINHPIPTLLKRRNNKLHVR